MVGGGQGAVRPADLARGILQPLEGLRGCHFVNKMSVCQGEVSVLAAHVLLCMVDGNQPI